MFSKEGAERKFAIICVDEKSLLSNVRSEQTWNSLDELITTLTQNSQFASEELLFAWKRETSHLSSAREPYAWRAALEEIKNSDLTSTCQNFRSDPEMFLLLTDKPVMLKIAGEITSALLHSYSSRHRISYSQV